MKELENKNWYVVYTRPRAEKKLLLELQEKSIESFLPLLPVKKKWSDRIKIVDSPIFTSYIFVKINFQEDSVNILKLKNALQFIYFNNKPAIIDDNDIELIKIFLNEYPDRLKIEQKEKLQKGNEVLIQSGPFKGRRAVIEKVKNDYIVILNLPLLNRVIKLEISKESLGFE